ncbi:MAG: hypothetical protein MJ197_08830 [Bacteroidales bacterium]|nr:hypothetical protein [Bacteroidales bacterium]
MNKKITELGKFFASCKVTRVKNEGAKALELKDVEDTSVVFECDNEEDIAEGTKATPDGVFNFANGKKITIEDGVVTAIEVVEEVVEKPAIEPQADEAEEIEKDYRIAELEAENNDLKKANEELIAQVEELKKQLEGKEEEVEANNQRLAKLESFAKALQDEGDQHKEIHENKKAFSFKRK